MRRESPKKRRVIKKLTKEECGFIKKEAAQRYTDTSLQIHKQETTPKKKQQTQTHNKQNGVVNGDVNENTKPLPARKVVQIETVETTTCSNGYESDKNPTYEPVRTKVDVLLKPSSSLRSTPIQNKKENYPVVVINRSKFSSLPRLDKIDSTVSLKGEGNKLRMSSLDRRNVRRFVEVEVRETTATFQPSKLDLSNDTIKGVDSNETTKIHEQCNSVVMQPQPKKQPETITTKTTEQLKLIPTPPRKIINYCSDSESSERTNKFFTRGQPKRFIEVQTIETTTKFVPSSPKNQPKNSNASLAALPLSEPEEAQPETQRADSESGAPDFSTRKTFQQFESSSIVNHEENRKNCSETEDSTTSYEPQKNSAREESFTLTSDTSGDELFSPRGVKIGDSHQQFEDYSTLGSTTSYEELTRLFRSPTPQFPVNYLSTSDMSGDDFYENKRTVTPQNHHETSAHFSTTEKKRATFPRGETSICGGEDFFGNKSRTLGMQNRWSSYEPTTNYFTQILRGDNRTVYPQKNRSGETQFYQNKTQNRWSSYETKTNYEQRSSNDKRFSYPPRPRHRIPSFGSNSKQSTSCQFIENVPARENQISRIILHTHDDTALNNGSNVNKMLTTSSSYNGFGEALTSQPRSSRGLQGSNGPTINMDLSYVTERIISLYFPPSTTQHSYRQGQRQAAHMLRNKHGDNYMVFNLSEPKRALRNEHKHVKEVGWDNGLAPPLEKLCSVCKDIDSWLSGDQHRIAVLHARGSKDKLGVIVAAYMHYSSICGSAEQALDRFSMRKFLDDNVGPLLLPSNKRYVEYFAGLLSHHIKVNAAPLYLTHVTVLGAPSFHNGGCKAFLKLYEGHTVIYTSGIYSVSSGVSQFTVNVAGERRRGLQLRGDILIKCYHRAEMGREKVFACQFHTCAVTDYTLSFTKQELDIACNDVRFPLDGAVELHFSPGPEARHPVPAPTPAVPFTLAEDPVARADSPLRLEESDDDGDSDSDDVNHTFGPLDGSIYATIAKKPELSPGAVSSPLTVSMDSGISSAGHQQNANTNASTSPPLTAQPSPLTPEEQHRELDELLNDMLLTVESIPDPKPQPESSNHFATLENVRYIDDVDVIEDSKNIPYHARQDSRPFTYGVNSSTMITDTKTGLSSPSLVRKASINKSSGDTLKKVQTQVYPDYASSPVPNFQNNNYNTLSSKYSTYNSGSNSPLTSIGRTVVAKKDPIDDIFTESALRAQPIKREFREEYYRDEVKRYDPLKRSLTEGTIRRSPEKVIADYKTSSSVVTSPYSDSESLSPPGAFRTSTKSPEFHETFASKDLTWLQRQQQKLKERKELQLREERHPHEIRLMSELRSAQSRHMRPTASHRLDGYTSDTTAFADDDDDYTIPLHINTKQPSSRTYNVTKTMYTTKNERPFMAVKRAHEQYAQNEASAAQLLAANPLGQIIRTQQHQLTSQQQQRNIDQVDSGLLSLVEQQEHFNTLSRQQNQQQQQQQQQNSQNLYREESIHSWRSQSVNEMETSPSHSSSPRPQTPAFPVHARTPYFNSSASSNTVQFDLPTERLPPKSPTTQRRLSFPSSSSSFKNKSKWSLSPERKDRPTSPSDLTNGMSSEYHSSTIRSVSTTPPAAYRDNYQETYQYSSKSPTHNGSASPTVYYGNSRRSSIHSNSEPPQEVSPAHVKFVRDTSSFWYKPTISREEAINMLRDQPPGTFVVRDSNSFPGAFGMALKVSTIPNNVHGKSYNNDELVRHFLIEPTSRGVRLKGCQNEPVFSSLSALIYQHSITQMALPCRLLLPEGDLKAVQFSSSPAQQILTQGAACNVIYLFSFEMESLTGPEAIRKAVFCLLKKNPQPESAIVHFKVNGQGITLTDNKRKLFFRRHYPINTISHCGIDPGEHTWTFSENRGKSENRIFGFIARKSGVNNPDNQCHLFAELEPEQPATAIVNFVNKILTSSGIKTNIV